MAVVGLKDILVVLGFTGLAIGVPIGVVVSRGGGTTQTQSNVDTFDYQKYCPTITVNVPNYGYSGPMYTYTTVDESSEGTEIIYEDGIDFKTCEIKK